MRIIYRPPPRRYRGTSDPDGTDVTGKRCSSRREYARSGRWLVPAPPHLRPPVQAPLICRPNDTPSISVPLDVFETNEMPRTALALGASYDASHGAARNHVELVVIFASVEVDEDVYVTTGGKRARFLADQPEPSTFPVGLHLH